MLTNNTLGLDERVRELERRVRKLEGDRAHLPSKPYEFHYYPPVYLPTPESWRDAALKIPELLRIVED